MNDIILYMYIINIVYVESNHPTSTTCVSGRCTVVAAAAAAAVVVVVVLCKRGRAFFFLLVQ